jgi:hypothetical protein
MTTHHFYRLLLIGIVLLGGMQAHSQTPKPNTYNKHRGFFVSLAPGVNLTSVIIEDNYGSSKFKGAGTAWDFKIGGTLTENLILHATLLGHSVYEPKIYDSNYGLNGEKADNLDLYESMIGAGLTFYTTENYLVSTSFGLGGFTISDEDENEDYYSDPGFCFQLKAGREWWLTRTFGLGVAVYYHYTRAVNQKNSLSEETIKGYNYGFVLNATLNGRR